MADRFFITGLPRSRTAWFSVAATTQTSVCFHEPTPRLDSFQALRDFWAPKFGVDIGIADSALAPQIGRILDELKPRTLIVQRPAEEAITSFKAYAEKTGLAFDEQACRAFAGTSLKAMERLLGHPLVKTVSFHALDDYDVCLEALQWILPGREFPDLRALMGLNIQVSARRALEDASRQHAGWHMENAA